MAYRPISMLMEYTCLVVHAREILIGERGYVPSVLSDTIGALQGKFGLVPLDK